MDRRRLLVAVTLLVVGSVVAVAALQPRPAEGTVPWSEVACGARVGDLRWVFEPSVLRQGQVYRALLLLTNLGSEPMSASVNVLEDWTYAVEGHHLRLLGRGTMISDHAEGPSPTIAPRASGWIEDDRERVGAPHPPGTYVRWMASEDRSLCGATVFHVA